METNIEIKNKKEELEDDHYTVRERLEDFVKVTVLLWAATLLTFSYVRLPDGKRILEFDPTFIASVFSVALASFGLSVASKNKEKNNSCSGSGGQCPEVRSAIDSKK